MLRKRRTITLACRIPARRALHGMVAALPNSASVVMGAYEELGAATAWGGYDTNDMIGILVLFSR